MKLVPVVTYVTAAMKKSEGGGGGRERLPWKRSGIRTKTAPAALLPVYGLKTL